MNLAISALCDGFRGYFGDNKVELFVFPNRDPYSDFYRDARAAESEGGLTWKLTGGLHIYVNPWERGSIGGPAKDYEEIEYQEVAAHEFGHAFDIASGLVSNTDAWREHKTNDINALNGATPCDASTGPFRDVADLNRGNPSPQSVCDGSSVRPDYTGSNFNICQQLDPAFQADAELHAQMFAYALVGNLGARPMVDKIIDNGFFFDLKTYAEGETS